VDPSRLLSSPSPLPYWTFIIPAKPTKAIAIIPIVINVIPIPLRGAGTGALSVFFLIPASRTIASYHPNPLPRPKNTD